MLNAQWNQLDIPTEYQLDEASFINADTGVFVGDYGTIIQTFNGGETWSSFEGFNTKLIHVQLLNNVGYVAGNDGFVAKTEDYGQTWNQLTTNDYTNYRGLWFLNENRGFLCGSGGHILTTSDGGASWSFEDFGAYWLRKFFFFEDSEKGFLIGDGGRFYKTIDGGKTWLENNLNITTDLTDIYFTNENIGYISADSGELYKTWNGGDSWELLDDLGNSMLTLVHFFNEHEGVVFGKNGLCFTTKNEGVDWIEYNIGFENNFWGISFPVKGSQMGYLCGSEGLALKQNQNGGGITDGLVLYYPFNGNANDHSGNDIHGDAYATLTTDREGIPNSAYHFDGINEFINIPYDSRLKNDLPMTVSLWAYFEETPVYENFGLFTNEYLENYYTGIWMTYNRQNKLDIAYGDGGGIGEYSRRSKRTLQTLDLNQWYHIVGVYRGATDMEIYINCFEDEGLYHGSGGPLNYSDEKIPGAVAKKHYGDLDYFQGKLDEIAFWNRALSAEEVEELCFGTLVKEKNNLRNDGEISVYPNPVSTFVNIDISNFQTKQANFMLYNMYGRQVEYCKLMSEQNQINIQHLNSGIYLYVIRNMHGIQIGKGKIVVK